jgi:hypothetical protein
MNTPQWLKPALIGAVIGAVALGFVGFKGAGWMTAEAASRSASSRSSGEVVAALLPICVVQAEADAKYPARLAKLKGQPSYQQSQTVVESGWATMPGSEKPHLALSRECAKQLVG